MIKTKVNGISWIEKCDKKWIRSTKRKIDNLYAWICNNLQVVKPPLKNYCINIKDGITGEFINT